MITLEQFNNIKLGDKFTYIFNMITLEQFRNIKVGDRFDYTITSVPKEIWTVFKIDKKHDIVVLENDSKDVTYMSQSDLIGWNFLESEVVDLI